MTHRGPFQPLLFCDSVILILSPAGTGTAGTPTAPCARAQPRWSSGAGRALSSFGERAPERS